MFARLRNDVRLQLREVIELVYYMRGAIQYDDMMWRTPAERQMISEFIEERFEMQKGAMHPVF